MHDPELMCADFAKALRWFERICGVGMPLALCSADGRVLRRGGTPADVALAAQLAALAESGFAWPFGGGGLASHALGDGHTLLYRPIEGRAAPLGWLATRVAAFEPGAAPVGLDSLAEALEDLAATLGDECRLKAELDGMAVELAERYEELHLVYGVDQHARRHGHEGHSFQQLLEDCARQLDVDVVAFVRPGESECKWAAELSRPIHNLDLVLVELRGDLFRFVQSTREPLVLNDANDPRRAYVLTDMPYKVLACPVRDGQQVDGAIVLLNHDHKADFANSDRRLAEVLASHLSNLLHTHALVKRLGAFTEQMAAALVEAVEAKDPYTRGHSERVHHLSMEIGRALGLDEGELEHLFWGSLLHDVGKIGIPDAVLRKPGKLTSEEFALMQRHCELGYRIFDQASQNQWNEFARKVRTREFQEKNSPMLRMAASIALSHHERWDGTGYPRGLAGDQIPIEGRITAVADVFDALSSKRPYKPALPLAECYRILEEGRGTHFDPAILDAFLTCREEIAAVYHEHADEEDEVSV